MKYYFIILLTSSFFLGCTEAKNFNFDDMNSDIESSESSLKLNNINPPTQSRMSFLAGRYVVSKYATMPKNVSSCNSINDLRAYEASCRRWIDSMARSSKLSTSKCSFEDLSAGVKNSEQSAYLCQGLIKTPVGQGEVLVTFRMIKNGWRLTNGEIELIKWVPIKE